MANFARLAPERVAAVSPEEEQASMYNAEGEFVNPYCRLANAPKLESFIAHIPNDKGKSAYNSPNS